MTDRIKARLLREWMRVYLISLRELCQIFTNDLFMMDEEEVLFDHNQKHATEMKSSEVSVGRASAHNPQPNGRVSEAYCRIYGNEHTNNIYILRHTQTNSTRRRYTQRAAIAFFSALRLRAVYSVRQCK